MNLHFNTMDSTGTNAASDLASLAFGYASCTSGRQFSNRSPHKGNEYTVFIEDVTDHSTPPLKSEQHERIFESKHQDQQEDILVHNPKSRKKLKLINVQPFHSQSGQSNHQSQNYPSNVPLQSRSGGRMVLRSHDASATTFRTQGFAFPNAAESSSNSGFGQGMSFPGSCRQVQSPMEIIDSSELFGYASCTSKGQFSNRSPHKGNEYVGFIEDVTDHSTPPPKSEQHERSESKGSGSRMILRSHDASATTFRSQGFAYPNHANAAESSSTSGFGQGMSFPGSRSQAQSPIEIIDSSELFGDGQWSSCNQYLKSRKCFDTTNSLRCNRQSLVNPSGDSSEDNMQMELTSIPSAGAGSVQLMMSASVGVSGEGTERQTLKDARFGAPNPEMKRQVSLKCLTIDPYSIKCDVIICLWNKHNIDTGEHRVLSKIGQDIKDMAAFRSSLELDKVQETGGGRSSAGSMIHCKYDLVAERQIANALLRCIHYTESLKKTSIVLPAVDCDGLCDEAEMVTRAVMSVIAYIQKTTRYKQNLREIFLCVDSEDTRVSCRTEFNKNKKKPCQKCHRDTNNKAAKLKPLSQGCTDCCCIFCIQCLKEGQQDGLVCPQHGPCLPPIGHKNAYAVLVAGFDPKAYNANIFSEETKRMARLLQCSQYVGISGDNVEVITTEKRGKGKNLKQRVLEAFASVRQKLLTSPDKRSHSFVYFYYTGHNNDTGLILGHIDTMTPKELKKEFRKLEVETILCILDCCYSGGAGLTEHLNSEDMTLSLASYSLEGLDSLMYLPRLWNLEETGHTGAERESRKSKTKVYQWSSCIAEEKSFHRRRQSLFTDSIIEAVKGLLCSSDEAECDVCKEFQVKARKADGIFLNMIHESVEYHVSSRAMLTNRQQHPQLDCSHKEDLLFAFHSF